MSSYNLEPRDLLTPTGKITLIGYWDEEGLDAGRHSYPKAQDLVTTWDPETKEKVLTLLKLGGEAVNFYRGYSTCRFCGILNGTSERYGAGWLWPQGLAHYVEAHSVALPEQFIKVAVRPLVCAKNIGTESIPLKDVDTTFWIEWASRFTTKPQERL